jgi:hypothetical protein
MYCGWRQRPSMYHPDIASDGRSPSVRGRNGFAKDTRTPLRLLSLSRECSDIRSRPAHCSNPRFRPSDRARTGQRRWRIFNAGNPVRMGTSRSWPFWSTTISSKSVKVCSISEFSRARISSVRPNVAVTSENLICDVPREYPCCRANRVAEPMAQVYRKIFSAFVLDLLSSRGRLRPPSCCCANSASVFSPLMAANVTFALNAGEWVRRVRLAIIAPDAAAFSPLLGRNSTYRSVRIWPTTSIIASDPVILLDELPRAWQRVSL